MQQYDTVEDRGAICLFLVSDVLCSFPAKDAGGTFVWNTNSTPSDERLELQKHLAVAFKQTNKKNPVFFLSLIFKCWLICGLKS